MTPQVLSSVPLPPPPVVLLVDDDADTREMYHMALEMGGYWVAEAPAVSEAMQVALEVRPDVIVTDLRLAGGGDGVDLARLLRANDKTSDVPVLALTGRDASSLGSASSLFTAVLQKPILPDELIQRIKDTLRQSAALRARSNAARARVPGLLQRSANALDRSERLTGVQQRRACPQCGADLVWAERRKLSGVTFDYYRPCANGCGLYCYNHSDRRVVALTE